MSFWDKMTEPQPINTFFDREKRRAERLKNFERYELEMAQKEQELIEKLEARNKKLSSENIVLQNKLFAMYKKNGVTLTKHTLEEILDAVSEYTSQSKESIRSKTRKPCYVWARHTKSLKYYTVVMDPLVSIIRDLERVSSYLLDMYKVDAGTQ